LRIFRDIQQLPIFKNAVVTIGSFDGVHLGHRAILQQVVETARRTGGESVVITFHPHPRKVLFPDEIDVQLLSTIEEKADLLSEIGIDALVIAPFTPDFAQFSAFQYLSEFLVKYFQPKHIIIGYDHHFGNKREGNVDYLKEYEEKYGFQVTEITKKLIDESAVSSTRIRKTLETGKVEAVQPLLGYFYQLNGTVTHGQKIGRTIGFPTANIVVLDAQKLVPPTGIYAVRVTVKGKKHGGMLYIGNRPTLEKFNNRVIEVNIFDFEEDIYDENIKVEFIQYTRGDVKFTGLPALKAQLAQDEVNCRKILQEKYDHVAVVILNYNGKNHLATFLPTVIAHTPATIIIADNGSTDDSIEFLHTNFSSIQVIDLKENTGFAEGYNRALQHLKGEKRIYILLNSDVAITENWLAPLIETLENAPNIAACQPKILSYTDKIRFEYAGASGGWMDVLGYPFCRGRIFAETEIDAGQYDAPQAIFWATGAALAIKSQVFHDFGGFDGDYFAHSEEIDLCWRMKRAGYGIMVAPRSVVYHVGGGTLDYLNPRKTYLNFRNSLYTCIKNYPIYKLLWFIPLRLILDGVAGILFLSEGKIKEIGAILRAHLYIYSHIGVIFAKRKMYDALIKKHRIGTPNRAGEWQKSVVWAYYLGGKKRFNEL
jgi:riboflavin kinase/FMN adenylyltransferase